MKIATYFWSYLVHCFLEWQMFPSKVVEEIKTHFMSNNTPPHPPENRTVYEIMWANIVEAAR
jgi:hypothetical protein